VRPVDDREGRPRVRKMLPDKLQHQELVEIGIKQRPRNGIEFPVMVVRAPGQVDDHVATIVLGAGKKSSNCPHFKSVINLIRPILFQISCDAARDAPRKSGESPAAPAPAHREPAVSDVPDAPASSPWQQPRFQRSLDEWS
jgi:hypothetical protein